MARTSATIAMGRSASIGAGISSPGAAPYVPPALRCDDESGAPRWTAPIDSPDDGQQRLLKQIRRETEGRNHGRSCCDADKAIVDRRLFRRPELRDGVLQGRLPRVVGAVAS